MRTVIPDADAAAAAWSRRTGVYPINHVVVVKDALLAEHPWLADELMRLFIAAKRSADDSVPYGIAANRPAIELLMRYAAEQRLIPRAYRSTNCSWSIWHKELTMADIPRLNGAIKALESGKPAFVPFTSGEISNALTISGRAV